MPFEITLSDVYWALNFILPTYATNAVPAVFGGGRPLDFGRCFLDGERIFGAHKTIRGFLSGLLAGTMMASLEALVLQASLFSFGLVASLGALTGDLVGAFIKRRMKLPPGYALPLLDQLDFVFGGVCFLAPFYTIQDGTIFIIILVTPAIHVVANVIAYLSKTKAVFW